MSGDAGKRRALPVDHAARERARSDLDTSFCVEAGAGTGKTTLLVGRFLAIVESGRASCGEIAAITFTEKAAGEMKIRLRREIGRRCEEPSLEAGARANLERALDELERSPISTIHSFAATILREHPVEARVDPNFVQLDALEGELFFDECWNDFLARGAAPWSAMLRRFVMFAGPVGQREGSLRRIAETLYARRGERSCEGMFCAPTPAGSRVSLPPRREDPAAALRDAFAGAAERLAALARDHCVNAADLGCAAIGRFASAMEALGVLEGDDLSYYLLTIKLPKGKGNRGNWRPAEACAGQKEIFGALAELQEAERARLADELRDELERFFDDFLASVDRRKASLGVLDFDDLLIKVRELCRDGRVLDELRGRYRYILVDEFQDTDPVQAEIVYLLAGAPGGRGAAEPAPGKLFIVGDPKQSIYRFRKADIEMYERVKERLSESGERLSIVENFRSVPGIVEWVNETFSDIMRPSGEERYQPRYEAIHPFLPGDGPPVVFLDLELGEEQPGADAIRKREGEAIARLVRGLVDGGTTARDAETGAARSLEHGDIAVIYPGTPGIDHYEEPLRREKIPYVVEGGKLYYAREEIRSLAAAIWAVEDPYDAVALVAALRSPLFGASDEEIFLFKHGGGRFDYLDPGENAAGAKGGLGEAFDLLAGLHRRRNDLGPSGTILELLRRTKFLELSLLRPHGEQRVSNVRKAISIARAFEDKSLSYRRFARWFKDQEALASAEGESPVVEEGDDAVRLLTVHKAKGLQFPVVILANLAQGKRGAYKVLVSEGRHISFDLGLLETSDHAALADEERAREEAETVRLLYVAATRAGAMLVIPRTPKDGSYFGLLKAHLGAPDEDGGGGRTRERSKHVRDLALSSLSPLRGTARPFTRLEEPSEEARRAASRERAEWIEARELLIERSRKAPLVLAPSRIAAGSFVPSAGGTAARPRDGALLFGQAFHRIMELAGLGGAASVADLARAAAAELGIAAAAAELERLARVALESGLLARAARAKRRYRETPFTLRLGADLVEGRIDLLFEEEEGWTVVDYKTDDVDAAPEGESLALYRPQAAIYVLALERLGIRCAGGVVFYFVRPNAARTIPYSSDLVVEAEGLVKDAATRRADA